MAPAEALTATDVSPAALCFGMITPCAPARFAVLIIAPRVCGSSISSRININGFGIDLGEPGGKEENVPEIVQVDHFDYAWDEEHDNNNFNIRFSALFNKKYFGKVVVNGEEFVIYD